MSDCTVYSAKHTLSSNRPILLAFAKRFAQHMSRRGARQFPGPPGSWLYFKPHGKPLHASVHFLFVHIPHSCTTTGASSSSSSRPPSSLTSKSQPSRSAKSRRRASTSPWHTNLNGATRVPTSCLDSPARTCELHAAGLSHTTQRGLREPVHWSMFRSKTMQVFMWQEDLFLIACYICACKLMLLCLKIKTLINPTGIGWMRCHRLLASHSPPSLHTVSKPTVAVC